MRVFGADLKVMATEIIRIITEPVQKLIVIDLTALGMIQLVKFVTKTIKKLWLLLRFCNFV